MADEEQHQEEMRGGSAGEAEGHRSGRSGAEQPSEEELRAQLEEEIRKVRVEDVVLQSAVSILNLSARRIAKDDERDLEQAKVGIDAARGSWISSIPRPSPNCARRSPSCRCCTPKHAGEESAPEQGSSGAAEGRFRVVDARRRPLTDETAAPLFTF